MVKKLSRLARQQLHEYNSRGYCERETRVGSVKAKAAITLRRADYEKAKAK